MLKEQRPVSGTRMKHYHTFKRRKSDRIDAVRLHQLAGDFREVFDTTFDAFYQRADEHLNKRALSDEIDAQIYANALIDWRNNRDAVMDVLNTSFETRFNWQEGQRPSLEEIEEERRLNAETEWSLMEDHSLEISLAVERFSARAISRQSHQWDAFHQRMRVLTADRELKEQDTPFNPHELGTCVFDAIAASGIPFPLQSILFRLFDEQTAQSINGFFQQKNEWLIEEGILPNLTPETAHTARPDAINPHLIQKISTAVGGSGNGVMIDPEVLQNLMTSVSALQAQSADIPDVSDLDAVKAWAGQQARTVTQQFKGSDKSDTISLVSMLFEYFFEDGQLVDQMKHLLAKMQIPIIKVAILDSAFFDNNQHPARLLLNKMARAASGWQPGENLDEDTLLNGMTHIVSRLNTEFEENIDLFDELLNDFEQLKQEYDRAREQALAETRRREQQLLAEHEALDRPRVFLNNLLDGAQIPEDILTLLDTDWYRLMRFILDKQGENQNWRNSARIAKELVWSLSPIAYRYQSERFELIVPKMLSGLEDGLRALGYKEDEREELFDLITRTHQLNQKKAGEDALQEAIDADIQQLDEQIDLAEQLIAGPIPLLIEEPDIDQKPADLNFYLSTVFELEEGQWFDFHPHDDETQRICLSVIVGDGAKYVFTDSQGHKSIERSGIGIAMAMRNEQLILLDDDNLIDRTLKSVAEALPDSAELVKTS